MSTRRCVVFLFVGASAWLSGCGGTNLKATNVERLKVGMSLPQVEGILGKESKEIPSDEVAALMIEAIGFADGKLPGIKSETQDFSGAKGLRWGDDKKSVTIVFVNDRASRIFKKGF